MADGTGSFDRQAAEVVNEAQLVMGFSTALHRLSQSLEFLTAHATVSPAFESELRAVLADAQNNLNMAAFNRLDRFEDDES